METECSSLSIKVCMYTTANMNYSKYFDAIEDKINAPYIKHWRFTDKKMQQYEFTVYRYQYYYITNIFCGYNLVQLLLLCNQIL